MLDQDLHKHRHEPLQMIDSYRLHNRAKQFVSIRGELVFPASEKGLTDPEDVLQSILLHHPLTALPQVGSEENHDGAHSAGFLIPLGLHKHRKDACKPGRDVVLPCLGCGVQIQDLGHDLVDVRVKIQDLLLDQSLEMGEHNAF